MSIRVEMADLPEEIVNRGPGFLLSSILDSRPHAANLRWEVAAAEGQVQMRAAAGKTARANCRMRPAVTLLFPAADDDGHSLIVDGEARVDEEDEHVIVTVVGAVLHRPRPEARGRHRRSALLPEYRRKPARVARERPSVSRLLGHIGPSAAGGGRSRADGVALDSLEG